ncbi:spermatogenesis-associated protein 20-like isoform X1 [Planococcus citri]|uniref:spermatogenesis-associated protein 20-like isoform X1 n=1 Tax=Planococcus citri TaxID=170843 RepID=UPI0031F73AC9
MLSNVGKLLRIYSKNCVLNKSSKRFLLSTILDSKQRFCSVMAASTNSSTYTNQLIHERSPYLLQHARNPVNWYPWGNEAIEKAKNENKIIFLSVGYSTCHWCHVMEKESFENESVAKIMNEHFVNIKVDREERPDIDKLYMTFIQLTSDSGGWPMSVFLTPNLHPIAGGTYFPPEDKYGRRGFKSILQDVAKQWRDDPEKLSATGQKVISMLEKANTFEVGIVAELTKGAVPEESCIKLCYKQLSDRFDRTFGGFDFAPKFPQPCNLSFLFYFYAQNPSGNENKLALSMALKTLEMMAKGGIHDHIGQGFARYSTDEKWHVPHFEKMLYDQGQLAVAYSIAYMITERPLFRDVLIDILAYVDRDLSFKEGGFYSAEDADSLPSEGAKYKKEGAFYVWTYEEIESLLSQPLKDNDTVLLSDVFIDYYNVKKTGNVDPQGDPHGELLDQNVLIVFGSEKNTAEKFNLSEDQLKSELETARKILFVERNKRPRPHLDSKIITSWNGLMLSGYAIAAQALRNDDYKDRAIKSAEFIKKYLWNETSQELLHCCYVDDKKENVVQIRNPIHGFLNDYAFLIRGLLDLYDCTYDPQWIEWGNALQEKQNQMFWDAKHKAYNLNLPNDETVLLSLKDDHDGAEPSGNSVTLQNLLRLSTLLDRSDYSEIAEQTLSSFTSRLTRFPLSLPEMVYGLMFHYDSATQIFVIGSKNDAVTKDMLSEIHKLYIPNRVLAVIDDDKTSVLYRKSETIQSIVDSKPSKVNVHVCKKRVCSLPVYTVESLKTMLTS